MDPTYITKIAAAGAMAISIVCIYKVYELLKNEQEKKKPRAAILKSINKFMFFAIFMSVFSLVIEIARSYMDIQNPEKASLVNSLEALAEKSYFSLNKNGNPEEIKVKYNNQNYVLGHLLPENNFENIPLRLKKAEEDGKYSIVKDNNGTEIKYGYLSENDLKAIMNDFESNNQTPTPQPGNEYGLTEGEKLMSFGMLYTPFSILGNVKSKISTDSRQANKYLTKLIGIKDGKSPLQATATKLLTQPELMNDLEEDQYEKIIELLASGKIRSSPWNKYEIAQLYLSRAWKSWNKHSDSDKKKHEAFLKEYILEYENKKWISDNKTQYPVEYDWYKKAKAKLEIK